MSPQHQQQPTQQQLAAHVEQLERLVTAVELMIGVTDRRIDSLRRLSVSLPPVGGAIYTWITGESAQDAVQPPAIEADIRDYLQASVEAAEIDKGHLMAQLDQYQVALQQARIAKSGIVLA